MLGKTLLLAGAAMIGLTGPVLAQTTWSLFTPFTSNDKPTQLYREFAEDVKSATDGKLVIEVFSAGELPYKNSDVLKALSTNQIEIADLGIGPVAGDVPELNVFVLPFICTTTDEFYSATADAIDVMNERLTEKFGVRGLMAWTMPPQQIWLKDSVSNLGDLAGRKIRTWNRTQVEMLDLLGASGVPITQAEVIPALQRSVVDGAITAVIPAYDWKFFEVTDYGYMLGFTMTDQLIAVNESAFAELDEETQRTLTERAEAWQSRFREAIDAAAGEARTKLEDEGMTLIEPSADDIAKARELTLPLWEKWANDNGDIARRLLTSVSTACGA